MAANGGPPGGPPGAVGVSVHGLFAFALGPYSWPGRVRLRAALAAIICGSQRLVRGGQRTFKVDEAFDGILKIDRCEPHSSTILAVPLLRES